MKPVDDPTLIKLIDERTASRDHALRQLEHLRRELDYGYPPAALRPARREVNRALGSYFDACEAVDRRLRARS